MNLLRSTIERMRSEALEPRYQSAFDKARARHPALASHDDIASVLATLKQEGTVTYPAREALSRALLVEHQARTHRVWSTVLCVAYYPMLSRLSARLIAPNLPRTDLDQLVLTSFLGVLDGIPTHGAKERTALYLRQRTQREVFRALRDERSDVVEPVPPERLDRTPASENERDMSGSELERVSEAALRAAEGVVSIAGLELVRATIVERVPLRDYVALHASGDEIQMARAYQRMKRQRSRALAHVRAIIEATSPLEAATRS